MANEPQVEDVLEPEDESESTRRTFVKKIGAAGIGVVGFNKTIGTAYGSSHIDGESGLKVKGYENGETTPAWGTLGLVAKKAYPPYMGGHYPVYITAKHVVVEDERDIDEHDAKEDLYGGEGELYHQGPEVIGHGAVSHTNQDAVMYEASDHEQAKVGQIKNSNEEISGFVNYNALNEGDNITVSGYGQKTTFEDLDVTIVKKWQTLPESENEVGTDLDWVIEVDKEPFTQGDSGAVWLMKKNSEYHVLGLHTSGGYFTSPAVGDSEGWMNKFDVWL